MSFKKIWNCLKTSSNSKKEIAQKKGRVVRRKNLISNKSIQEFMTIKNLLTPATKVAAANEPDGAVNRAGEDKR